MHATFTAWISQFWEAPTCRGDISRLFSSALFDGDRYLDDFVLKLRGWEMLDPNASLADAGVVDGSILLLAYRRRRPVR